MRYPTTAEAAMSLLLGLAVTVLAREGALLQVSPYYTDVDTGITFYGQDLSNDFRFGMVLPTEPTTDLIMQLVTPLKDGAGWGGIALGNTMLGHLMLVTWADGNQVMISPRIAQDKTAAGVVPYTRSPITLSPISHGTFVNATHVSSTFLCAGCINHDSFDPAWAGGGSSSNQNVYFGYAFSQAAVENPSSLSTALSDHTSDGKYAAFRVDLSAAKSDKYDQYTALVGEGSDSGGDKDIETGGVAPTTTAEGTPPTSPAEHGWTDPETEMPNDGDSSHRQLSSVGVFILVAMGAVYLGQAILSD
ncbi:hypothetical protein VTK26DRAFT_2053 [Humicola hyalothermophila]